MAHESVLFRFREELLRFRASLHSDQRELLDELIRGALSETPAPALTGETHWTQSAAEELLKDTGQLKIDMPGGYQTCGGDCISSKKVDGDPEKDPQGDLYCLPSCHGDVASGCQCHLYGYDTPKPGTPPPPRKDWDHEWKPGDPHFTPKENRTYKCVCVRKKP